MRRSTELSPSWPSLCRQRVLGDQSDCHAGCNSRMSDIELMSDLLIGLMHGPQGGSGKVIDTYYEQYEPFDDEFPEQTRITRLFNKTLEQSLHSSLTSLMLFVGGIERIFTLSS